MLTGLLAYFPFLTIALVAQWSDRYRAVRWVTYGLLLLFDASAALGGLLALLLGWNRGIQRMLSSQYPGVASLRWDVFGLVVIGTTLLAPVFLLPYVRRGLAHLIPVDPESGVHATALALAVLAAGLNLSQVALIGGLSVLAASAAQVAFLDLLASNLPIGLFALVGVGFLVRRTARETWERLGLERVTWRRTGLTIGLAVVILVFYYGVDRVWRLLAPESYEMMEALGEVLYGGVMVTWQAIAVSLVAGVTEELFFRGALQPRFGLLLTAILFTGVHVQYGLTPATLEVFGGALALGWLRQRTNTSACMLLHVLYDVAGLLVFPLLP
ncbi:MAG: lysostaphin resistance A-like protein [Anaerolineae bacterium]